MKQLSSPIVGEEKGPKQVLCLFLGLVALHNNRAIKTVQA